MTALNSAMGSFKADLGSVDEGLGSCQPMSDTIELATAQVCDEVMLGMQMVTAVSFGLTCLLMYGTLHRWFGSDVAKELTHDEEQSLFAKLTSESLIEARSKFGTQEKTSAEKDKEKGKEKKKKDKSAKKKTKKSKEAKAGEVGSTHASSSSSEEEEGDVASPNAAQQSAAPTTASPGVDAPGAAPMEVPREIEMKDIMNDDGPATTANDALGDDDQDEFAEDAAASEEDDGLVEVPPELEDWIDVDTSARTATITERATADTPSAEIVERANEASTGADVDAPSDASPPADAPPSSSSGARTVDPNEVRDATRAPP
jgi:hypothetical protein